jgi:hypothetical protein
MQTESTSTQHKDTSITGLKNSHSSQHSSSKCECGWSQDYYKLGQSKSKSGIKSFKIKNNAIAT